MKPIRDYLKAIFPPEHPKGIIRFTWALFLLLGLPFLLPALRHAPLQAWIVIAGTALWAFTFSNAYLNRLYWQSHQLMIQNQMEMLNQIQYAYYLLHEHCPNCGARLKAPPEVRQ